MTKQLRKILAAAVAAAALAWAGDGRATSFADQDHYLEFMDAYGSTPELGSDGVPRRGRILDPTCAYLIGSGRCSYRGGGGAVGIVIGPVPRGGGSGGDMPEDAEGREGDGRDPMQTLQQKGREAAEKHAVKQVLYRVIRQVPRKFLGPIIDFLIPTRLSDDDVIFPPRKVEPILWGEDGELQGETRVPEDWQPQPLIDRPEDVQPDQDQREDPPEDEQEAPPADEEDEDSAEPPAAEPGDGVPLLPT